jgi:8-oxo-dGTP diphosphatase
MPQKQKKYCYPYPRPAVTVDVVCLRRVRRVLQILLIRRKHDPFQGFWALPGGFVNIDEDLEPAARRELREETGLRVRALRQVQAFGKPDRDPRHRTISIAFLTRIGHNENSKKIRAADDAADVQWFKADELPDLAFDHREIIRRALKDIE